MKDENEAAALVAVIVATIVGIAFSGKIIHNSVSAQPVEVTLPQGRAVRGSDVGCSRFPNSPVCACARDRSQCK